MKKQISTINLVTVIIATVFSSCKKDIPEPRENFLQNVIRMANSAQPDHTNTTGAASAATPLYYNACNMTIKIFEHTAGYFNMAMVSGTGYQKFGVPNSDAKLDFQNIDYISFEFSGSYADAANKVKLYRIKRTDGKYLSLSFGLSFESRRLPGSGEEAQLWIFNDLGNDKYNLIAPKLQSNCYMAKTYTDNNGIPRLGWMTTTGTLSPGSSTTIYLIATAVLPPNTK